MDPWRQYLELGHIIYISTAMILSSLLVSGALLTPRLHVTRPHVQRTCPVQMIGALDGLSDLLKKDEKPAAGDLGSL